MPDNSPAHPALCTLFPGSLTRKLYRKKIPEKAGNVPEVPGRAAGGPVIAGRLTIERNKNGHRTGQVPEIWGEWEFPLRAYLPGGFRLTIVPLRVP